MAASQAKGKKGKVTKAARAGMLLTHRGFSGPAVLDLSHHAVMAMERGTPRPGAAAARVYLLLSLITLVIHEYTYIPVSHLVRMKHPGRPRQSDFWKMM